MSARLEIKGETTMKLLSLPQAPTRQQAMFFRSGRLGPAAFFLFSLAIMGALIYGYAVGDIPFVLMLVFVLGSLIFLPISLSMLVRSFQATNWLFALGPDRLDRKSTRLTPVTV